MSPRPWGRQRALAAHRVVAPPGWRWSLLVRARVRARARVRVRVKVRVRVRVRVRLRVRVRAWVTRHEQDRLRDRV